MVYKVTESIYDHNKGKTPDNFSEVFSSDLPALIPRDVLFNTPLINNPLAKTPRLSPDGKKVVYMAPGNNILGLWIKTIGHNDKILILDDEKKSILDYLWVTDNYIIYFQDTKGTQNWVLYRLDLETDEIKRLTPSRNVQVRTIGYSRNFPDEIVISMNKDNPELHDLYHINIISGETILMAKNPGNVVDWLINSKLQLQGMVLYTDDGSSELMVRADEKSEWKKLLTWDVEDKPLSQIIGFSKDNSHIYLTDTRKTDTCRVIKMEIATGNIEVILHDQECDIVYIMNEVLQNPFTGDIQAVCIDKPGKEWVILDQSIKEDFDSIKKLDYGDVSVISRDKSDETWLISFDRDNGPVSYYAFDRRSKQGTFLFYNQPELNNYTLSPMEEMSFTSRDGLTIHGYITYPPGLARNNLPLVMYVHGGPWWRDTWGYNPTVQWFANRGYVCLQVNYRGSIRYGKQFLQAGYKEWGGKMHDDIVDAVKWAVKNKIADPQRIAIYGASYGGYEALVGATVTPDLFCCAVAIDCPSNLITLIQSASSYLKVYRNRLIKRIGDPDSEKDFLISRSPFYMVEDIKIPILITHGLNNQRVKSTESYQIVKAMKSKGIEAEYIVFPDEGRVITPKNLIKFHLIAEKFLAKHLGGRVEERKCYLADSTSNTRDMNEKKVIEKILKEGDKQIFEDLVESYRKRLLKYLFNITGNIEASREILQETFLRAWLYMDSYCFDLPFSSWIFKIATNVARKNKRVKMFTDELNLDETTSDVMINGWEENIDDRIFIKSILNTLKEPYRTTVILRFIEDMNYNDIASVMHKNPQQIKNYLFRARKYLIPPAVKYID
ncbi:MAG: sigma-70 family RNA polymerase sigma factor [Candidatus Eremiobacterota bacterium]